MGLFSDLLSAALTTGMYICSKCGTKMEFEDSETEDVLICPNCGHSVDLELYGMENGEDYDSLYPLKEDICECEDNDDSENEYYDEVCDELSHDD